MIRTIGWVAVGVACAAPAQAQLRMAHQQVAPGVYVIAGFTNGNILALEGSASMLLVDAQSAQRAAAADTVLRSLTSKPVEAVINTHYHEDHIGGNAYWRGRGARIIAHGSVAHEASRDTLIPERNWRRTALPVAALPTAAFDTAITLRHGDDTVHVYFQRAHTAGDAIVWVPARNVLHAGDVVEIGAPPQIDFWAGGTLNGMLDAVDFVLGVANDSTIIVPGHGPPINRAMLRSYRMQLVTSKASCGSADASILVCAPPLVQARLTADSADVNTPDAVIAALYDVISGPRWQARDWVRFRSLFAPTARLATSNPNRRAGERAISSTPDQFIGNNAPFMVANGFVEREVSRTAATYGSVYHAFSTYEFQLTGAASGPGQVSRGINSIQLQYDGARWWITALTWDSETKTSPIPEKYLGTRAAGQ